MFSDRVDTRLVPPGTATPAGYAAPPGSGRPRPRRPGRQTDRRTAGGFVLLSERSMPASSIRRMALPDEGLETLFGPFDENLRSLESALNVTLKTSGHDLVMEGDSRRARTRGAGLRQLAALLREGYRFARGDVKTAAQLLLQNPNIELQEYFLKGSARPAGRRQVTPKSVKQRRYLEAIDQHDIVFGVGPAGTGKTYLAMAQAVALPAGKEGHAHHPRASRGGSRREAGLPARRPAGKGQPVPAAALRRALRHARRRTRRAAARARRRSRWRRSRSCAAAR